MSRRLRIAFFLGSFPVISETFILRQITGLLDLGHDVRIFANARPEEAAPIHPEVAKYHLLNRTTYVDGPAESVVWELPVWPLSGRTWPPGQRDPSKLAAIRGGSARRGPVPLSCAAPHTRTLDSREYGYQAESCSGVYRLDTLCRQAESFDVLHAHLGRWATVSALPASCGARPWW
jgi:hypothetical protein